MKKITNKILWISAIVIALLLVASITIPFQIVAHQHPEICKESKPSQVIIHPLDIDTLSSEECTPVEVERVEESDVEIAL